MNKEKKQSNIIIALVIALLLSWGAFAIEMVKEHKAKEIDEMQVPEITIEVDDTDESSVDEEMATMSTALDIAE